MGKEDYKNEKKGHGFLCVPKELLFDNRYKQLTIEAILLYAYMLDRLKLSIENGWKDSDGKVFIYFSLESIMDLLKCSKGKAISTLKELDENLWLFLLIGEMSEMSVIDNIRLTFLYIEFYSMGKTWVYPESYIPYNIFRYIVKGKAEFCIDGEEIIVKENQIVYIPQGCRMSCRALSESFEFYSLRFTTSVFYEGEDVLKEYYGIPRIIENEGEDYYFKEICKWVKKDSWVKKCFVRGYLDLLIGTLSMRVNKFDKNTGKVTEKNENPVLKIAKRKEQIDSRVQLVADYVVLHPREKYTPQKMAEMVELSKQRFSSLFKANMGKSPMEYVREIRLTTAARALLVSNKNINDIAYECGYEDANYFIREFKSAFGFTPNQYRKIARE